MSPRSNLAALSVALVLAAGRAAAQAPAQGPCLEARADLAAYVAAFEAEGWAPVEGAARLGALGGPSENLYLAANIPLPAESLAELAEILGAAHRQGAETFARSAVLTRGEAAVAIDWDILGDGRVLRCVLAAPDLPEVDAMAPAARAMGDRPLPFSYASLTPPPPPGVAELRVEAIRHEPAVTPAQPLPGAESLIVTLTRAPGG